MPRGRLFVVQQHVHVDSQTLRRLLGSIYTAVDRISESVAGASTPMLCSFIGAPLPFFERGRQIDRIPLVP
jgi:hypothetical protein